MTKFGLIFKVFIFSFYYLIDGAPHSNPNDASSITRATIAPVQILSTCQPGQYFKRDCKFYISCENGKWRRNFCPGDKYWNHIAKKCDDIHNVPECYQLFFEIQHNAKMMMVQSKTISSSWNNEEVNGDGETKFSTSTTTTPTTMPSINTFSTTQEDYDDEYEEMEDTQLYSREERDHKAYVLENPYFSAKDYEDYDDDDEENSDSENPNDLNQSSTIQPETKTSKSSRYEFSDKNDIITEDMYDDFKKFKHSKDIINNSHKTSAIALNTYGKICIFRGETMECHNASTTTETTNTKTMDPTTIVYNHESSTTIEGTLTTDQNEETNSRCKLDLNASRIHSYSFKIEINIDDRLIQQIERIIKIMSYYISFQFLK